MVNRDPRIDTYIAQAGDFAKPVLTHLRAVVHRACPQVEETLKWNFPHFMYHGMLCSMAAFKQHCAFGFWKNELVVGSQSPTAASAMGQFGRLVARKDLPADNVLIAYIHLAMQLNERQVKPARVVSAPRTAPDIPPDLAVAFKARPRARTGFAALRPSQQRDYVEWIDAGKREATRRKRIAMTLAQTAAGEPLNRKYAKR